LLAIAPFQSNAPSSALVWQDSEFGEGRLGLARLIGGEDAHHEIGQEWRLVGRADEELAECSSS
jgi:hypothetical protein